MTAMIRSISAMLLEQADRDDATWAVICWLCGRCPEFEP